ncbi:D-amino acid dehydrogenase [Dongia sedimenti]|uniref:D-amino acid dehydrogenase n=1 Tax=Dongia sedimenti TaxID=3064282 RepID=A0ABU0YI77_9PROT|nr:D-amino acid dehydrogenase [Rhodospirillaceae bacterium R-7]
MHVVVLGAGLLGVTTAHYLAREGHQVTVIDRQKEPARETSFANAGLLTPGHAYAWASPRAPMILLRSLWRTDTALRWRLKLDPGMWAWGLKFLANCTAARNRENTVIKVRLCSYSLAETAAVTAETGITWDRSQSGALYLYRDPDHFRAGRANFKLLADEGVEARTLEREELATFEPSLAAVKDRFAGAIHTPHDESGDARKFTTALADSCRERGVTFKFGATITRIERSGDRVTAVESDRGRVQGDAYVLALGSYSPLLTKPLGFTMPIYPVKGYSVTLPIADREAAPAHFGVDEANLVAFARLGDRLRLTATADFAGYDTSFQPRDFVHMLNVARELFPRAAAFDRPEYWACLRPMTPDGPPIMGPSPLVNLWLNTGHGHIGWTMACGSSRIVVDRMLGRKPEIDDAPFRLSRY